VVAVLSGAALVVANAGDSRCVLCRRGGVALDMSLDHKPEDEPELARILAAGGEVTEGRVEGNLNLSRAIGDLNYKRNLGVSVEAQMITALPEVRTVRLEAGDRFVVLACDGIWNVLTSQAVVDLVGGKLDRGVALGRICEEVMEQCLAPDMDGDGSGCDNMTMMVVLLPAAEPSPAEAAAAAQAPGSKRSCPANESPKLKQARS
jgi:protein phosphatase 1G